MDNKKCGCGFVFRLANILLVVGGINWGLVGIGMLLGLGYELNIVQMVFGSMPVLEGIIYLLVGISAIVKLFDCSCKEEMCCDEGGCNVCTDTPKVE
jgi:uncharacterized membrane protein YuzA (DUF378 family)